MIIHDKIKQGTDEWNDLRGSVIITASEAGAWLAERPVCRLNVTDIKSKLDSLGIEYDSKMKKDDLIEILPAKHREESLTELTMKARRSHILRRLTKPIREDSTLLGHEFLKDIDERDQMALDRNAAIQRGNYLERYARDAYRRLVDDRVIEVGFITTDDGEKAGCSPDGLIVKDPGNPIDGQIIRGLEIKCPAPDIHQKYRLEGILPPEYAHQVHFSLAVTGLTEWDFFSFCPGLPPFHLRVGWEDLTSNIEKGIDDLHSEYLFTSFKLASDYETAFDGRWKEEG